MPWLAVAIGGALGAVTRYGLLQLLPHSSSEFPWAIWLVNLLGAILIGACYVVIIEKALLAAAFKPLLMVGFLGALTTFSTVSLDTWLLWHQGAFYKAAFYAVSSLLVCLMATATTISVLQRLL